MTDYEEGFLAKCAEHGVPENVAGDMLKQALFEWTHHLVPWETPVELRRKARRAMEASDLENHPAWVRFIMDRKYKDPIVEHEIMPHIRRIAEQRRKTQGKVDDIKRTGVFPKGGKPTFPKSGPEKAQPRKK